MIAGCRDIPCLDIRIFPLLPDYHLSPPDAYRKIKLLFASTFASPAGYAIILVEVPAYLIRIFSHLSTSLSLNQLDADLFVDRHPGELFCLAGQELTVISSSR